MAASGFTTQRGSTGLRQFGGVIDEEWLRRLQGVTGKRVYREMADNDPTVGALLFSVEMLLRNVEWRVEPFSDDPVHQEQAEFVESLVTDMSITWEDFISEAMTMLSHGFAPFEILYKRRVGPLESDPIKRSRHTDGLIGWRKLAIRSQDTVDEWVFDEDGGLEGFWQLDTYQDGRGAGERVFLPMGKLLLFRTTSRKNNPEGRSVLRNAFVPWFRKKRIEEAEAIGVERDLAGMPIVYVPNELFDPNASAEKQAQLAKYYTLVEEIKNDEQAGVVLPSLFDPNGNRVVEFTLAGTGSRRLFDTTGIIRRYDQAIAQVVLGDFVLLGHEKVGSFALADTKTAMFSLALGAWLKEIASVLNRHGLPRLYDLNGWDPSECAELVPGDIEQPDLDKFSTAVANLAGAGFLTPGGERTEAKIRELLDLPEEDLAALGELMGPPAPPEETPLSDPGANEPGPNEGVEGTEL